MLNNIQRPARQWGDDYAGPACRRRSSFWRRRGGRRRGQNWRGPAPYLGEAEPRRHLSSICAAHRAPSIVSGSRSWTPCPPPRASSSAPQASQRQSGSSAAARRSASPAPRPLGRKRSGCRAPPHSTCGSTSLPAHGAPNTTTSSWPSSLRSWSWSQAPRVCLGATGAPALKVRGRPAASRRVWAAREARGARRGDIPFPPRTCGRALARAGRASIRRSPTRSSPSWRPGGFRGFSRGARSRRRRQ